MAGTCNYSQLWPDECVHSVYGAWCMVHQLLGQWTKVQLPLDVCTYMLATVLSSVTRNKTKLHNTTDVAH